MASVVELTVQDVTKAAEYYEALLAVNPQGRANDSATLMGDHLHLKLSRAAGGQKAASVTLPVTCGMFARILDGAMQAKCEISVKSAETAQFTDQFGHSWTLQCRLS